MTGQLRDADKTQLENWIGQGPKNFTRLYSAKKDGCSAQKFHETCDHQGATVTVVYNQQCVFGGYTSASWNASTSGFIRDEKAFLFQLKYLGSDKQRNFPISDVKRSIFATPENGPLFGQDDMFLFSGAITNRDGYFTLNGSFTFGVCYTMTGVSNWNQIHNGDMNATDIEVYSVAVKASMPEGAKQEWREVPDWNKKLTKELMQEVQSIKPNPSLKIQDYRIVLIGPVGSGKSSFCNTVNSVFRGRITQRAICGQGTHSITTSYKPYAITPRGESTLRMRLCDTRGLEADQGIDIMEFTYLLNGHIPENYNFNAEKPIALDDPIFVTKPGLQDKVHCVVFVLEASRLQKLDSIILAKIKSFRTTATRMEIPQAILLTKIDIEDKGLAHKLETVHSSSVIEKKVEEVSDMLGFPKNHVFPVKNYEHEMVLHDGVNILALMALKQILYFAEDYMENQRPESVECPDENKTQDLETASESI